MIYRIPIDSLPDVRKIGRIRYANGWSEHYCHKRNVLIFVCSGIFNYTFNDHEVVLSAGSHLFIPAGVPYTAAVSEDCDYFFIHFETTMPITTVSHDETVKALDQEKTNQVSSKNNEYTQKPDQYLYISENFVHKQRFGALQYRISRCLEFRQGSSPLDRMRLLNSFFKVLLSLAAALGEQLLEAKHISPTFLKLTRYIEENYTSHLTLKALSEHFSLSKQYIMRLFREQAGSTVTHYINELRLRRSLDLLTYHSLSVSEVAFAVGFSNLYYFDRLFKKAYSITPTEFQKNHSPT